jgi:Ca2+-binding EF-hand superfamily protein
LKLVKETAGNILEAIGIDSRTQVVQQLIERIDKWKYMKLKSFYTTKEMVTKLNEETATGMEENFCQLYFRQETDN